MNPTSILFAAPGQEANDTQAEATLERDFLFNLLIVLLLLIGPMAAIQFVDRAEPGPLEAGENPIVIHVLAAGDYRLEDLDGPPLAMPDLVASLRQQRAEATEATSPVLIAHPADLRADELHHVLASVEAVEGVHAYIALRDINP